MLLQKTIVSQFTHEERMVTDLTSGHVFLLWKLFPLTFFFYTLVGTTEDLAFFFLAKAFFDYLILNCDLTLFTLLRCLPFFCDMRLILKSSFIAEVRIILATLSLCGPV